MWCFRNKLVLFTDPTNGIDRVTTSDRTVYVPEVQTCRAPRSGLHLSPPSPDRGDAKKIQGNFTQITPTTLDLERGGRHSVRLTRRQSVIQFVPSSEASPLFRPSRRIPVHLRSKPSERVPRLQTRRRLAPNSHRCCLRSVHC